MLKWPVLDADVPFAPFQLPKVLDIFKTRHVIKKSIRNLLLSTIYYIMSYQKCVLTPCVAVNYNI